MSNSDPKRGEVVLVRLDPIVGSEQAGTRPALVISSDRVNGRSPVILVAAITSQKVQHVGPIEAYLDPADAGLPKPSKVMLIHTRGIDKRRILTSYGVVSPATMARVDAAIRVVMGLPRRPPS